MSPDQMTSQPNPHPIRALLIDISGTLLIGPSTIPGAAHALTTLRAAHIPFRFCSNTSKESSNAVHARMRAAGLDVRRDEVWTSIGALKAALKRSGVKRPYMLLSKSALEECTGDDDLGVVPTDDTGASSAYDAVVLGLAPPLLDYEHLNTAFRILVGEDRPRPSQSSPQTSTSTPTPTPTTQPHRPLIALHKARYIEAPDHALSLGPGPFVHALEEAAQTSAIVVGKPTRAFFETVLDDLERDLGGSSRRREGIAVIGDDVHADLGEGAIELGLWRVLVKTGKYRPGDEQRKDAVPPDQVCASFASFVKELLDRCKTLF